MNEKITMRNTVAEIQNATGAIMKAHPEFMKDTKSKAFKLMAEISKKLEAKKRVTKKEWFDVYSEALVMQAAAEEKPKKTVKKESSLKKKPAKKAPAKKAEPKAETKEEPKKSPAKKTTAKKTATKKTTAKAEPNKTTKKATPKFSFPKQFKDEDGNIYDRADDLEDIKAIRESAENGDDLVIAFHWTKDLLKQQDSNNNNLYGGFTIPKSKCPKGFTNDLDLCTVLYVGSEIPYVLSVSNYTEMERKLTSQYIKKSRKDGGGRKAYFLDYEFYRVTES